MGKGAAPAPQELRVVTLHPHLVSQLWMGSVSRTWSGLWRDAEMMPAAVLLSCITPAAPLAPSLCSVGWSGPQPHSPESGTRRQRMCTALGSLPAQLSGPAHTQWTSTSHSGGVRCLCVLAVAKPICLRNFQVKKRCILISAYKPWPLLMFFDTYEYQNDQRRLRFFNSRKLVRK